MFALQCGAGEDLGEVMEPQVLPAKQVLLIFFFPFHRRAKMDLGQFLCKELYNSCLWKGTSCKDGASLALGVQNHPYWVRKDGGLCP